MRKIIVGVLAVVILGGCANIPKTTTYREITWKEVEETQPAKETIEEGQQEELILQPAKTIIVQADIPSVFPGAKKGRKYLNIGYRPVNPNRQLVGEEVEVILPLDTYVETPDRDGKVSKGWMLAGERVAAVPTNDPNYYKAVWIRRCGNPILNDGSIAIFIKIRREIVQAPPIKVVHKTARVKSTPQPSVKRMVPTAVEATRELTCAERKAQVSWWRKGLGYVVTGVGGVGGALIGGAVSHSPHGIQVGAGVGVLLGRLVGGYTDGTECITGGEVVEGALLGVTAGMLAPTNSTSAPVATGHPLPPNGPVAPVPVHPLPPNGPSYGGFVGN